MKILVSTADYYNHLLPGFAWCFNKYWPGQEVTVLGYAQPPRLPKNFKFHSLNPVQDRQFNGHLRPYIKALPVPYFVFLMVDYWLQAPVNTSDIALLEQQVLRGAAKADISCSTQPDTFPAFDLHVPGTLVYQHRPECRSSLLAAIWVKPFMVSLLAGRDCDPWQFEGRGSHRMYDQTTIVGLRRTIYDMGPSVHGVYKQGRPFMPVISTIPTEDKQALKTLGYRDIENTDLTYTDPDEMITCV